MKNCPAFHQYAASADFLRALVKCLPKVIRSPSKKNIFSKHPDNDKMERAEKILIMIQSYAMSFERTNPAFMEVYRELQHKGTATYDTQHTHTSSSYICVCFVWHVCIGVKFPEAPAEENAPVLTPPKKVPSKQQLEAAKKKQQAQYTKSHASQATPAPLQFDDPTCQRVYESVLLLREVIYTAVMSAGSSVSREQLASNLLTNDIISQLFLDLRPALADANQRVQLAANSNDEAIMMDLISLIDEVGKDENDDADACECVMHIYRCCCLYICCVHALFMCRST